MNVEIGNKFKDKAIELLNGPTIYYNAAARDKLKGAADAELADCQALMELIAQKCGVRMSYAGSNDMFRNACSIVVPLAEARQKGLLVNGAALFILEHNGAEPAKYRDDGIGNSSHVGMYIGEKAFFDSEKNRWCNVIHSSSSRGKVCGSTTENAWTHVGLWKCANYGVDATASVSTGGVNMTNATVVASSGTSVNLRKTDNVNSALVVRVPIGSVVQVETYSSQWSRVTYEGYIGYMKNEFLSAASSFDTSDSVVSGATITIQKSTIVNLVTQLRSITAIAEQIVSNT